MKSTIKPWSDGGSLSVTYDGNGDGSAIFSSDINEGINREMSVTFIDVNRNIQINRQVLQFGKREKFSPIDGEFILFDGGMFNVLKQNVV